MLSFKSDFRIFLVLAFCCLCHAVGQAQSSTATLTGNVADENGAVVPSANVTVTNPSTGMQRHATTGIDGLFSIPLLPPSTYTVLVERQGFATAKLSDVVLNVNTNVDLNIRLKVGQIGAEIVIVNDASQINTSPSTGTVVDRKFIQNIPLNQRSIQPLILLSPGIVPTRNDGINTGQFSVNGQRTNSNYFSIDGVSANIGVSTADVIGQQSAGSVPALSATGGTNNLVSLDALEEFRIETSTFAPEFGRTPGGQVSLITRSGTTSYHGALFEYFRNDIFDANDWFANRSGLKKAPLRQNQFGATLSGPIAWLRFGEGPGSIGQAKHSFFFFSYEGLRLRQPQTSVITVPSLRLRQQAPAVIQPILNSYPIPTGPETGTTGQAPFVGSYSNPATLDATSLRIDHNFSDHFTLFGRFNYSPSNSTTRRTSALSNLNSTTLDTTTFTVSSTAVISPTATNDIRFNYSTSQGQLDFYLDNFGGAIPFTSSLFIPTQLLAGSLFSAQAFSSINRIGPQVHNSQKQFNLVDTFSLVHNNHAFKLGADFRRLAPEYGPRPYLQALTFSTQASLLSGNATLTQVLAAVKTKPRFNNFSAFSQDTWKLGPQLTLTYGIRWELNPPPTNGDPTPPFVINNAENAATAQLAPSGTPLWKTTYNNFAPRIGLAYTLFQKPGRETVLRGGFGLFYDLGNGQGGDAFAFPPYKTVTNTLTNVPVPLTPLQAATPSFPTDPRGSIIIAFDPNLKLPYTMQFNITIEQSLGPNQTFSAAYVGALGRRQLSSSLIFRPNPNLMGYSFVDNGATSSYHSMQLHFQRRLSRGLQAMASYTWSHAIDYSSSESQDQIQQRGDADFDIRHSFSSAVTYDIPRIFHSQLASSLFNG